MEMIEVDCKWKNEMSSIHFSLRPLCYESIGNEG